MEFKEGPKCSWRGSCGPRGICYDEVTIRQAIEDDKAGIEANSLQGIADRCKCENPKNLEAQKDARKYLKKRG